MTVRITYDPAKRAKTLSDRDLDFEAATEVFAEHHFTALDERFDYGEERFMTTSYLAGRMMIVVWTPRGDAVISFR